MTGYAWADPAPAVLGDLRPGDFIITIPSQAGVTGQAINSGIAELEEDWQTWTQRIGRRGRMTVRAIRFSVLSGVTACYPADFTCTARIRAEA